MNLISLRGRVLLASIIRAGRGQNIMIQFSGQLELVSRKKSTKGWQVIQLCAKRE